MRRRAAGKYGGAACRSFRLSSRRWVRRARQRVLNIDQVKLVVVSAGIARGEPQNHEQDRRAAQGPISFTITTANSGGAIATLKFPLTSKEVGPYAQSIVIAMTGNASFPSPTPTLAVVSSDIVAFEAAETATLTRTKGSAATTGSSPGRVPRPAGRSWPAIRTSPSRPSPAGTKCIFAAVRSTSPA